MPLTRSFVLALLAAALLAPPARAAGIVFRYLPGQVGLSSEVVLDEVEEGPFLDPREWAARAPGGWGWTATSTAEFEAPGSTLRSAAAETFLQALGPRLTAEAWVRPYEVPGEVVLLTNRVGEGEGFVLGLADGIPFFELQVEGRTYRVEASRERVAAGQDRWLAATAVRAGNDLNLDLYVDGRHAARTSVYVAGVLGSAYTLKGPFLVGTAAEGDPAAPTLRGTFSGHVYAAVVRDYTAREAYLASPPPFDGSPYFGLPAYHDYPLAESRLPMDQRMDDPDTPVRYRYFIPYANDGYIPQGVATHVAVEGADTTRLVYVAYYHRTRSGVVETHNSIITEMDVGDHGRVRRTFRLTGRLGASHAGGIAYHGGALFVSSVGFLERYPLPPYEGPEGPRYYDLAPDEAGSIAVASKASFVSTHRDTLWVGDWRTASDVAPYLYAYPLGADGRPTGVLAGVYALPRNIQGVDLIVDGAQTYVFLSRNRNSREAELYRIRREDLHRYNTPRVDSVITMPHGIEDLSFFPDGTLWTNSESGTDYYQRGARWSSFYPFVYGVPASALLPGGLTTAREPSPGSGRFFRLDRYPNPAHGVVEAAFELDAAGSVRLRVYDMLGREVAALIDGVRPPGHHAVRWEAGSRPAGTYFLVLESGGRRAVRSVTLLP